MGFYTNPISAANLQAVRTNSTQTTSFTAVANTNYLVSAATTNITVTLPTSTAGQSLLFKKTDSTANLVTLSGSINGSSTTLALSRQNQAKELYADGSGGWNVILGDIDLVSINASSTTAGLVQLTGDLGGTPSAPTTPTAVHLAGAETITGAKTFATDVTFAGSTLSTLINETQAATPLGTLRDSATYVAGSYVELTTATGGTDGELEYTIPTSGWNGSFDASFDMWAGGGNGADGIWFYAASTTSPSYETNVNNGYAIYFSEYAGTITIYYNNSSIASTPYSNLGNSTWRTARITLTTSGAITVYLNGTSVLTYNDTVHTYTGTKWGFGARCGGNYNEHRVRNMSVVTTLSAAAGINVGTMVIKNNKITNVTDPTSAQDVATKNYVDANAGGGGAGTVHLAGAETITGVKTFSVSPSVPTPVNASDATPKSYVDSQSASYVSQSQLSTYSVNPATIGATIAGTNGITVTESGSTITIGYSGAPGSSASGSSTSSSSTQATSYTSVTLGTFDGSSNAQSITSGFTVVNLNTVVSDASSNFNVSTYAYTVPTSGVYLITAKIRIRDDNTDSNSIGMGVHTTQTDGYYFKWSAMPGGSRQKSFDYTRIDSFSSGAQLKLYTYGSYIINAASLSIVQVSGATGFNGSNGMTVSNTAPSNPSNGDLWVDTN